MGDVTDGDKMYRSCMLWNPVLIPYGMCSPPVELRIPMMLVQRWGAEVPARPRMFKPTWFQKFKLE